jgi:uncharacterized protein YndB with AHSA1/START domain
MGTAEKDDGLTVALPTDTTLVATLDVGAPKEQVFRAWTTPEFIKRWWGGDNGKVTAAEVDLRVGGTWRWVIFANGSDWGFHGEYLQVIPGERLLYTDIFENQPEMATFKTITFADNNERTNMTIHTQFNSKEHRDTQLTPHWQEGLEGMRGHLERVASSIID